MGRSRGGLGVFISVCDDLMVMMDFPKEKSSWWSLLLHEVKMKMRRHWLL